MKNLISAIALILTASSFSQTKLDSYNSSYWSKDFNISVAQEKDGTIQYYIECGSMDASSRQVMLMLKEKQLEEFKFFIASLKETYLKWTNTAKENKVTELTKDIEYKKLVYEAAFSYGDWNFDFNVGIKAYYRIINDKYLMIIRSDALQSSSNQYIKSDGFSIVFSSAEEFDELLSKLDNQKAQKYFDDKKAKEDLFKN